MCNGLIVRAHMSLAVVYPEVQALRASIFLTLPMRHVSVAASCLMRLGDRFLAAQSAFDIYEDETAAIFINRAPSGSSRTDLHCLDDARFDGACCIPFVEHHAGL